MTRLITAEFRKLLTTRLWLWLLLTSLAWTAGYCALAIAVDNDPGRGRDSGRVPAPHRRRDLPGRAAPRPGHHRQADRLPAGRRRLRAGLRRRQPCRRAAVPGGPGHPGVPGRPREPRRPGRRDHLGRPVRYNRSRGSARCLAARSSPSRGCCCTCTSPSRFCPASARWVPGRPTCRAWPLTGSPRPARRACGCCRPGRGVWCSRPGPPSSPAPAPPSPPAGTSPEAGIPMTVRSRSRAAVSAFSTSCRVSASAKMKLRYQSPVREREDLLAPQHLGLGPADRIRISAVAAPDRQR